MMLLQVRFFLLPAFFLATTGDHVEDDCHGNIELALLTDRSLGYGEGAKFEKVKLFIKLFLQRYDIGPRNTRLGAITFSKKADVLFGFNDEKYQNQDAAASAIDAALADIELLAHPMTELALIKAHDVLFKTPPSNNKQRVLFVFFNGTTPYPHLYEGIVKSLEAKGVNIVAVSPDEAEAKRIAGKRGHAIVFDDIYDALTKLPQMVEATCLVHGGYTEWGEWGGCSQTCGSGKQSRSRTCTNPPPSEHGKDCGDLGSPEDERPCNTQPCGDIDGGYSMWTEWSNCSHICWRGVQIRHRLCVNPPQQDNGQSCDVLGSDIESQACSAAKCGVYSRLTQAPPCEEGIDLAILVDQSLSVSKHRLTDLLTDFFPPFIDLFNVSVQETHVGVLRFSRFVHFVFIFADRKFRSDAAVSDRINLIDPKTFANTRIDRLLSATFELFNPRHGDRADKQNVLAVFTDGKPRPKGEVLPFNDTIVSLREVKKTHIVAVGYGRSPESLNDKINKTVLKTIAGDNVVVMDRNRPGGYASYAREVQEMVCAIDGGYTQWSMWSLCSASCGAGTQSRSRTCTAPPPREGGEDCKGESSEARACDDVYCPVAPPSCKNLNLDLAFVIEASSELGEDHFLYAKEVISKIIHLFDIAPTRTRVSLVLYHSFAYKQISFDQLFYQNNATLASLLNVLQPFLLPGKRLDSALQFINDFVFVASAGDRPDIQNVAVFFTDGQIQGDADISHIVSILKNQKKVDMVTVSVGTNVRQEVLYKIAGPKMALCTSTQEVKAKIEKIASMICTDM